MGGAGGVGPGPPRRTPGAARQSQSHRPVPGAGCWGFRGREETGSAQLMMSPARPQPGPGPGPGPGHCSSGRGACRGLLRDSGACPGVALDIRTLPDQIPASFAAPRGQGRVPWLLGIEVVLRGCFLNQENVLPTCSDSAVLGGLLGPLTLLPVDPGRPTLPRSPGLSCRGEGGLPSAVEMPIPVGRVRTRGTIFLLLWDFQFSATNTIFSGTF